MYDDSLFSFDGLRADTAASTHLTGSRGNTVWWFAAATKLGYAGANEMPVTRSASRGNINTDLVELFAMV